jgi:hypothetical protein
MNDMQMPNLDENQIPAPEQAASQNQSPNQTQTEVRGGPAGAVNRAIDRLMAGQGFAPQGKERYA